MLPLSDTDSTRIQDILDSIVGVLERLQEEPEDQSEEFGNLADDPEATGA